MQQGRYIAHKCESGWEVGVIKAFERRDLTLASSACSTRMIQTGGRTLFCVRVLLWKRQALGSAAAAFYLFLQKQKRAYDHIPILWYSPTRKRKEAHVMMLSPLP